MMVFPEINPELMPEPNPELTPELNPKADSSLFNPQTLKTPPGKPDGVSLFIR